MSPTHNHTLAPSNHATLPQPIIPIQSLPRTPLRDQPTPARTPLQGLPRTPIRGPGFPWQKPFQRRPHPCHTVTSGQLRTMSQMSQKCDISTPSDTKNVSHCAPIWPASTMSQMSHFSATKTRF